jgi:ssDNA-binding Zn-finger/Zn-ribbon topoisomerase 1
MNQNAEWAARQMVAPSSPRSIFRQKTGHKCPKCGSADTRVSVTRGILDIFMFLFDYSIGRCRNCDTRFRIWQSREEEPDLHAEPATE